MNSSKRTILFDIALLQGGMIFWYPPKLKETVQQHGFNMFLSTEFFSPQENPVELSEKIQALFALSEKLESEND